mmetsp:Transcript_10085/g.24051  ORF Transcript_10085/g.24051 Transcript_10085/m.24051 type:complete len:209 (+) Transcript_10085:256-882(+)
MPSSAGGESGAPAAPAAEGHRGVAGGQRHRAAGGRGARGGGGGAGGGAEGGRGAAPEGARSHLLPPLPAPEAGRLLVFGAAAARRGDPRAAARRGVPGLLDRARPAGGADGPAGRAGQGAEEALLLPRAAHGQPRRRDLRQQPLHAGRGRRQPLVEGAVADQPARGLRAEGPHSELAAGLLHGIRLAPALRETWHLLLWLSIPRAQPR